jgi:hypothetical protein
MGTKEGTLRPNWGRAGNENRGRDPGLEKLTFECLQKQLMISRYVFKLTFNRWWRIPITYTRLHIWRNIIESD